MFGFFRRSRNTQVIERLYGEIMTAARQPALYIAYGVSDSFEGRFELLTLHATLAIRRLARLDQAGQNSVAQDMAQDLTNRIFAGFDATLREMGVGDVTVPKRMKKLAEAFLGRRTAYDVALEQKDEAALCAALARNIYGSPDAQLAHAAHLARYVWACEAILNETALSAFEHGPVLFPPADSIG